LGPPVLGERGEGQDVLACGGEVLGHDGKLLLDVVDEPVELGSLQVRAR
jgi:hypothetical protein